MSFVTDPADAIAREEARVVFEKRLRGYRAIGYARNSVPAGYEEADIEPLVTE